MFVFLSDHPLRWTGVAVTCLIPSAPMKLLAPEIITHEERDYILAYQWRGSDERVVFIAPLAWD